MTLQAVGMDSCEGNQEETVTDAEGQYRLRGLQVLRVKMYIVVCFAINTHDLLMMYLN